MPLKLPRLIVYFLDKYRLIGIKSSQSGDQMGYGVLKATYHMSGEKRSRA